MIDFHFGRVVNRSEKIQFFLEFGDERSIIFPNCKKLYCFDEIVFFVDELYSFLAQLPVIIMNVGENNYEFGIVKVILNVNQPIQNFVAFFFIEYFQSNNIDRMASEKMLYCASV